MTPRTAIPSVFDVALLPTANARLRSVALIHEPGDTRSCQDTDIITTLSEGERGPAPLLESLTVTHEPELEPRNVYLPPCFLASDAPCLQSLVLQRCAISWESPLLRNLAHLSITLLRTSQFRGRRLPDGHNLSKRQLYDVLRNMPSLETVILKHALGGVSKTHGVFPDSIRFPRLISLSIADKLSNCVCLMGMVSIPPSTLCNLDIANFDLKPGFLPSLSQLGADAFPIRSLSFGEPRKPSEKFNICCWSAQQNWCSPTPRGDQPRWKLNTPVYNLNPSEMTKMGRLCLDELQEAWLDFTEAVAIYLWNTRDWAAVFERAPHVRSILVTAPDGADMNQFLRALDAPTPQTLLFPELRCLVFREIDRQEGTVDSLDVEDSDDDELSWMDTFVNPLVSCLSARLERGNTLDLLQLPEKYQGQAWIGRVEGVVSKLVFGPDIARRE
ncbi:hypothetical protein FA95DRAFT_95965 [Auriscalpium vulgare]|uniref:Uncharacterized protein n=1 Tax=Auriscalpium vulgare TaxID=40419 RepID=A0ACB8RPS4_9AGAM|nr:hypothetical protein FA95DRAFT_95965 [Auriscalpium vulgare]